MPDIPKVLVVGTTSDYIDHLRRATPGRTFFITDPLVRSLAQEEAPGPEEELLCDLSQYNQVRTTLRERLHNSLLHFEGISCFDCESMELTALLAQDLDLPYPDLDTVRLCRDKYQSKTKWQQDGVPCPQTRLIDAAEEATNFLYEIDGPCILKPLCGSGSELVYFCRDDRDCAFAFHTISEGLHNRRGNRLYTLPSRQKLHIVAEEYIHGPEYSADFIIDDNRLTVIRLTKKIHHPHAPTGTIRGYVLTPSLPGRISTAQLEQTLFKGARSLNISRAVCMVDFIVREDNIVLLEMTPRPGGDCLPPLLMAAGEVDILTLTLDFSCGRFLTDGAPRHFKPLAGLRLHADQAGKLTKISSDRLVADSRVRQCVLLRTPGHIISLPPADYDSWLLGHCIVEPAPDKSISEQCEEIMDLVSVEIS